MSRRIIQPRSGMPQESSLGLGTQKLDIEVTQTEKTGFRKNIYGQIIICRGKELVAKVKKIKTGIQRGRNLWIRNYDMLCMCKNVILV